MSIYQKICLMLYNYSHRFQKKIKAIFHNVQQQKYTACLRLFTHGMKSLKSRRRLALSRQITPISISPVIVTNPLYSFVFQSRRLIFILIDFQLARTANTFLIFTFVRPYVHWLMSRARYRNCAQLMTCHDSKRWLFITLGMV